MAKQMKKRSGYRMLVFCLVLVVLSLGSANILSNLAGFYGHMNQFNLHVKNHDGEEAQKELNNLRAYYNYFSGWKLGYFADRFLLSDMFLYEAETSVLNEDCEKAIAILADHQDDYRAINLTSICKFKALYSAYHSEAVQKDKKQKENILKIVLDEVKLGFKLCVEKGPGPEKNFNCSYNYDLVSDPESAQKALESQMPGPEFVLGRSGKEPGKAGPGEKRLEPDAGQGQIQKGG